MTQKKDKIWEKSNMDLAKPITIKFDIFNAFSKEKIVFILGNQFKVISSVLEAIKRFGITYSPYFN